MLGRGGHVLVSRMSDALAVVRRRGPVKCEAHISGRCLVIGR
nr:hypothetical protein [Kibdelosporangium sp. MJ126-NF4]CTQ88960.1 hypothetical protein [Kibdelosporangium sp. MJ126-NF4]